MSDDPPPPEAPRRLNRRTALLALGGASAAAAAGIALAPGASAASLTARTGAAFVPSNVQAHFLRRASYGPTPASLADVRRLTIPGWVNWQLNPAAIPDPDVARLLLQLPVPDDSTPIWKVRYLINQGTVNGYNHMMSVPTAQTIRAIWGTRQLQTVMEEFWGDLLHVAVPSDSIDESRPHYQYTLRRLAFGRFSDLLWAATRHPAMLSFLDNRSSTAEAPNENHGRELLELHTVGVEAGYTETDIKASARILSGLSVNSESGEYEYKPWRHATGAVRAFGFADPNLSPLGEAVAARWIAHLARHPATANRIAKRLCVRFVADTPPPTLVTALARTYLANGTAIAPVLRQLFASAEFRRARGTKLRRPVEHLAATARLLQHPAPSSINDVGTHLYWLGMMGQQPFRWPAPNGYPDAGTAWMSTATTLARWNSTIGLVNGYGLSTTLRPDIRTWLFGQTLPAYHGALVDAACRKMFGRTLPSSDRQAILSFLGVSQWTPVIANSASVTYRLSSWISLLLNTPYHLYR